MAVLGVAGLAAVLGSMLPNPGPDDAWFRDLLMTVGSSALLFVPFYAITRSLDRHLDRVADDTAQQVEEVRTDTARQVEEVRTKTAQQVEEVRAEAQSRIDDVTSRVAARLEAEAAADRDAFAALRSPDPTRDTFWDAFDRALRLGLVSETRHPRVNISRQSHLYVSVEIDTNDWADEPLQFRVETLAGRVEDYVPWPADQTAEDVLVEVGRLLFKHTAEAFDPALLLRGFADLLEAAMSHPERRPAIQLCPPQWMVCDWGVIAYDEHIYGVNLPKLQTSSTISSHVAEKGWVHLDSWESAYEAALALFPKHDPWASPGDDAQF
ncbi:MULTISPECIES: hypothetical protein [unclassified Nocardioides]|uniref:hypothetical protein n=1 Tax=unclassified Nocardioides TaxID=2615069 RepID=UPI0007031371|nr:MULTISPECIES: hypothetical protein [unclassified Nocardioides]KRA30971.1 hypothetical protein ASD81_15845 [Nocardioides sp. Root614]KRA87592.1 hypothetical protein ASD84_16120 [Nocardioides sp. Root682]